MLFPHSDQEAQPWGGPKADFSEAFGPTGNGGAGAEPPLTIILIKSRLTVRRPLVRSQFAALRAMCAQCSVPDRLEYIP